MKRPGSPILFTICVLIIVVSFGVEDRQSCIRSKSVREANRAYFNGVADRAVRRARLDRGRAQRLDFESYDAARHAVVANRALSCALPFPDTH